MSDTPENQDELGANAGGVGEPTPDVNTDFDFDFPATPDVVTIDSDTQELIDAARSGEFTVDDNDNVIFTDQEDVGNDNDGSLDSARAADETQAEKEAGTEKREDAEDGVLDKLVSGAVDSVQSLLADNETSRFSDRGVLGEDNIIRDMRYPVDALEAKVSKLPAVVSFEFFKRSSNTLQEMSSAFSTDTVTGFASSIGSGIGGALGFEQTDETRANTAYRNQAIIDDNLAQGAYVGSTLEALNQVKDVRLNRASEKTMDRIFMYVPNSISFTDSFDYEERSQASLRTFYEMAAGNSRVVSESIRQGIGSMLSKQVAGFTDTLTAGAVKFDPYNSLRSAIGLVSNDRNEQTFKGVQRKSFQFSFQFAPTSPKEAVVMQNIIQCFRFHSAPELAESTTQFFAPHEVDVRFFRNSFVTGGTEAIKDSFGREAEASEVYSGGAGQRASVGKLLENTEIPKIGRCFVTSVNLNYTPQAKSSFFVNGVPTEVTMAVTLQQAIMTNKQFVLQGF